MNVFTDVKKDRKWFRPCVLVATFSQGSFHLAPKVVHDHEDKA